VTAKSIDAFRTISEVAEDLDVPQHVLRFWEGKFSSIRPLKRGGGRRYYRPDDIDLLRGIRRLLHVDGYTIKGVQKVLRESGARVVAELGRGAITRLEPQVNAEEPLDGAAAESIALLSTDIRQRLLIALGQLEQARACVSRVLKPAAAMIERREGDGYIAPPQTVALGPTNPDGA
jgi:DNA-binding transcriptional MerR regulator